MKTEIIDFDLELAKKITSGEVEGEVLYCSKSQSPLKARIVNFDFKYSEYIYRGIALVTTLGGSEYMTTFSLGTGHDGVIDDETKLKLKVPIQYALKKGDFISNGDSVSILNLIEDDLVFVIATYKFNTHTVCMSECLCGVDAIRRATQEEKDMLLQALEENGYRWDAEKLELIELEKKHQFKPFDRVIGAVSCGVPIYSADLFSHMEDDGAYACIGGTYGVIYPFEGNEHLLKK